MKRILSLSIIAFFFLLAVGGIGCQPSASKQEIDRFLAEYAGQYGTDVKAVDSNGETLLHKAAAKWDIAVVKYLISKGADVSASDKNGNTPLYVAVSRENLEIAQFLVSKGADPNSAIYIAVDSGNLGLVSMLLSKGVDVNATGEDGSMLNIAIWNGNIELVEFLVSKGADVNAVGEDYGSASMVDKKSSPLNVAVSRNKIGIVSFLISKGANINEGSGSRRPLDVAIWNGDIELVEFLVSLGAEINYSALFSATLQASNGKSQFFNFFLSKGVDINTRDRGRGTLLHTLIRSDHRGLEHVKLLVTNGADVNASGENDESPLHIAIRGLDRRDTRDIIKYLVSHGANVNAKDHFGRTPLATLRSPRIGPSEPYLKRNIEEMEQYLISVGAHL